jgi:hypothetical protein
VKVFENRALRKIFGSKREEVREEWRRVRNGEALCSTPHQELFG